MKKDANKELLADALFNVIFFFTVINYKPTKSRGVPLNAFKVPVVVVSYQSVNLYDCLLVKLQNIH